MLRRKLFLFLLFVGLLFAAGFVEAYEKMVFGVVEKVTLLPEKITLSARLDTGAKSSSLDAHHVHVVEENHKKWVLFIVETKKGPIEFKKPLERYVKIKVRHAEKKAKGVEISSISRPVVLMDVKMGDRQHVIEVNLTNRSRFIYPFLLGREAIKQLGGIIDPSQRYLLKKQKQETTLQLQ